MSLLHTYNKTQHITCLEDQLNLSKLIDITDLLYEFYTSKIVHEYSFSIQNYKGNAETKGKWTFS